MIIQKEDRNEEKVTYSSERRVLFPSRKVYPLLLENSMCSIENCAVVELDQMRNNSLSGTEMVLILCIWIQRGKIESSNT